MERKVVNLQGFNIDTFNFDEAVEYIQHHSGQIVTINPEMIASAKKDNDFSNIIKSAELVVPDGIGVQIGLKILGYNVKRIAGIELGHELIKKFEGEKTAFIGAKPEIIQKAVENLKSEFKNLNAVYVQDGYFKDEDKVISELQASSPRLCLVALGSPKQEFFINKAKSLLPNTIFIGLGGSFDVWSGVVKRAPEIWQKLGLEWLYRTVKEPQRFKRIFPTLPLFLLNVVREKIIGVKNA